MQLTFNPPQYNNPLFEEDLSSIDCTKNKNIAICLQPHSDIKSIICDVIKNDFWEFHIVDYKISCSWMSSFSEYEEEELYKMIVKFNPVLMILDDSFGKKVFKNLHDDYRDFQETFKLESLFFDYKKLSDGNFDLTPYLFVKDPNELTKPFLKRFLKKKLPKYQMMEDVV